MKIETRGKKNEKAQNRRTIEQRKTEVKRRNSKAKKMKTPCEQINAWRAWREKSERLKAEGLMLKAYTLKTSK